MNSSVAAGTERSIIRAPHPDPNAPLRANTLWHIRLGVLICLVGTLASGCIFSPKKDKDIPPDKPPISYTKRNTAKGAVQYLSQAWTNRDSVRIDSVYADDYGGESIDLTDPNAQNLTFVKSDEVRTVGALALAQEITYTNMNLNLPGTWIEFSLASDPPEWRTIQVPNFKIEVLAGVNEGFSVTSPHGGELWLFEFTLRPTYPDGPSAEPVWEIVRWKESRSKN